MTRVRFETMLYRPDGTGTTTFLEIPLDVRSVFGRARPPVRVTINDHTSRSTVAVYGGRHVLAVNQANRKAAGVGPGDALTVELTSDDEPRTVELPPDLAAALAADPATAERFAALAHRHRLEYVRWVTEAKRPATRSRRVTATIDRACAGTPPR